MRKQREIRGIISEVAHHLQPLQGGVNQLFHDWVNEIEARTLLLDDTEGLSIVSWLSRRESCIGVGDEAVDKATIGYVDAAEAEYTRPRSSAATRGGRGRGRGENTGRATGRGARVSSPPQQDGDSDSDDEHALKLQALKLMIPLACAGKLSPAQTARVVAAATRFFDAVYPPPTGHAQLQSDSDSVVDSD